MKEGRGRLEGITQETAKGQTRGWQALLPNLERVNAVARRSGQTRFTALLHHVDVAALERAFKRQRRAASPGVDGVSMVTYEQDLEDNFRRLHDRVHAGQYWPKPVLRRTIPKLTAIRQEMKARLHAPVKAQQQWLCQVLRGHYGYYGVIFNHRSLRAFYESVKCSWFKALRRRSQKSRMNWQRFAQLLAVYPLPKPVIRQSWHGASA